MAEPILRCPWCHVESDLVEPDYCCSCGRIRAPLRLDPVVTLHRPSLGGVVAPAPAWPACGPVSGTG